MKTSELRIGNIVSPKQSIVFQKATQGHIIYSTGMLGLLIIREIKPEKVTVETSFYNTSFEETVSIDSVAPSPLTERNLLKCGFGEVGLYENVYQLDNFRIYLDKHKNTGLLKYEQGNNNLEIGIAGIHQLQNIYFILTGKELTVKAKTEV